MLIFGCLLAIIRVSYDFFYATLIMRVVLMPYLKDVKTSEILSFNIVHGNTWANTRLCDKLCNTSRMTHTHV